MALPTRPNSNSELSSLPDLPNISPPKSVRPHVIPKAEEHKETSPQLEDGWAIDPKTGKKYKKLAGYKEGTMKYAKQIIKSGGLTSAQLFSVVEDEEDFHLDDLNGSAETFLAHLRVPIDKEEMEELRRERAARQTSFDNAIVPDDEDAA